MDNQFFLIIGTYYKRIKDLEEVVNYASNKLELNTIIIHSSPTKEMFKLCDVVLTCNINSSLFVEFAKSQLSHYIGKIKGGVLFSDSSMQYGVKLFEALRLRVDSAELAVNAYCKLAFRESERDSQTLNSNKNILIPDFCSVTSIDNLKKFAQSYPHGFILKPRSEAASRGVVKLRQSDNIEQAFENSKPYYSKGLMCEELINIHKEVSYDGVATIGFVTEKIILEGSRPIELGQVVPAQISQEQYLAIEKHGKYINAIVGQNIGAFHNEIAIIEESHQHASIESNRRPGGMKIWTLAEKVYAINFYHLWVNYALNISTQDVHLSPKGTAMTCMLNIEEGNKINVERHRENIEYLFKQEVEMPENNSSYALELFDFEWLVTDDIIVQRPLESNDDFIASCCIFTSSKQVDVNGILTYVQQCWRRCMTRLFREEKTA